MSCSLLREYFDLEFSLVEMPGGGKPDAERIIDDFVLFCMMVGNDFLPGKCIANVILIHQLVPCRILWLSMDGD